MTNNAARAVVIRVDALARLGVGHLVRELALAEEFAARGRRVRLVGESDVPWALDQIAAHGLALEPPPTDPDAFAAALLADGVRLCIIDGYEYSAHLGSALRAAGLGVGVVCDGTFGLGQDGDLYVDQNLGATAATDVHPGAQFLTGLRYALLRDVVRDRRGIAGRRPDAGTPRVLVVFGGTDPFDGCGTVAGLLLRTGLPVEIVAIAARPDVADALRALPPGPGQSLEVHPPVPDLPGLAVTCDAAVSASGSSVWELACLGLPTAVVCVTDNQLLGYRAATEELCLPAGHLADLKAGGPDAALAARSFERLLGDPVLRRSLAGRGADAVDGCGRERVVDALLALEASHLAAH